MVSYKNIDTGNKKTIWIDLDNSPHVPFFYPIIKELEKRQYRLSLTARDCFQVCGLSDLHNLYYKKAGRHYGKNRVLKILGTFIRAFQLLPIAMKEKPVLAVSHGSRAQQITAALLGIPIIVILDYEFTQSVPFVKLKRIIAPEVVTTTESVKFKNNIQTYPGIKEDVYVPFFKPNIQILEELGINEHSILVTIRPPATEAHYHNPESEQLFTAAVEYIGKIEHTKMVILPRNEKKQTAFIKNKWPEWIKSKKIIIPDKVVNGLNLIWYSDLVISGGGTMNREAAALGVPVYSIFRGKIGAVDHYLSKNGRLTLLESIEDVKTSIKVVRRDKSDNLEQQTRNALDTIVKHITDILEK